MNTKLALSLLVITSITTAILSVFVIFQHTSHEDNILFQVSSLDSLMKGYYEGKTTVHDLLDHGDFGLGAMEYMDGELVCLDKVCYRITTDSMAHKLPPESEIAFATVVFFKPDKTDNLNKRLDFIGLQNYLDDKLVEKNDLYAIKIQGFFSNITARSVPKQDKMYVPLSDVVGNQTVFHFSNVRGTLVGFYMPGYMKELNVEKYHFHFITDDRGTGGHLLDLNMTNGTIQISKINESHIIP